MRTNPTHGSELRNDLRGYGSAGTARVANVCVMPAASWSFPTILVATGHKPGPRRYRVPSL